MKAIRPPDGTAARPDRSRPAHQPGPEDHGDDADRAGRSAVPAHQGWVPRGGRRGRWLEPFLLLLVAEGDSHGYAIARSLNELRVAADEVDVGTVYRALRELEAAGMVESTWEADVGAPRRAYVLTGTGRDALDGWAPVMAERARLSAAFAPRHARLAVEPAVDPIRPATTPPDPEGETR